jgi:haloalkane dehalogenase
MSAAGDMLIANATDAADWMANNSRNIETHFIGYGRHFIQEDNPEAIGRGIVDWHRRQFESTEPVNGTK